MVLLVSLSVVCPSHCWLGMSRIPETAFPSETEDPSASLDASVISDPCTGPSFVFFFLEGLLRSIPRVLELSFTGAAGHRVRPFPASWNGSESLSADSPFSCPLTGVRLWAVLSSPSSFALCSRRPCHQDCFPTGLPSNTFFTCGGFSASSSLVTVSLVLDTWQSSFCWLLFKKGPQGADVLRAEVGSSTCPLMDRGLKRSLPGQSPGFSDSLFRPEWMLLRKSMSPGLWEALLLHFGE